MESDHPSTRWSTSVCRALGVVLRRARLSSRMSAGAVFAIAVFGLLPTTVSAHAQGRLYRVASISAAADSPRSQALWEVLFAAMRQRGYVEKVNLIFDRRFADGDPSRLPALVDEAIALKPDVLMTTEDVALVVRGKGTSIPIVLVGGINPVKAGLADSLARPGKNVTGVALLTDQLPEKHIEMMREINPHLARVGMLVDNRTQACTLSAENARQAAQRIGAVFVPYSVGTSDEIERAFAQMKDQPPDVLLPCPTPVMLHFRELMIDRVLELRIPFTSFVVTTVRKGILFSYADSDDERMRTIARYVDRILKGASPAELPIEQPTKLELVLNLETARVLGLTIPPSVLVRADRVID